MQAERSADLPPAGRAGAVLRPLATWTYLIRNAGKTAPLIAVITMAVLLVAGIVSLINSIPYSIRTTYSYSRNLLGITPRGDNSQVPKILKILRTETPVPIERLVICRASSSQVRSIVGKWPFAVLGLSQADLAYYLERMGSKGITGRLPKPGEAEAIVSEPVARNLGLKLGSVLQGPDKTESYSQNEVRVVGIARTKEWVMANSIEYQRAWHFPEIDNVLVFARNRTEQERLDRWAVERLKGLRAMPLAYHMLEKDTREMFSILYRILDVVIGTLVLVIAVMMGMLMNIYQSQRLVEFGLLQALGYTKRQLLRRVLREAVTVILTGWAIGVVAAYGLLNVVKALLMDPQAFALNTLDPIAFAYTLPIPTSILAVAMLTVWTRFRSFDPVSVVERRLV